MKYLLFIVLIVAILATAGCVSENKNTIVTPLQTKMVQTVIVTTTVPSTVTPSIQPLKTEPVADNSAPGKVTAYFFYGKDCGHCHNVMPFIQNLSEKYPDADFQMIEVINNQTNMAFFKSINQKLGISGTLVPEVVIGDTFLIGDQDIPNKLEGVILEQLKKQ
jgi:thiol-disulfide isomerase/thioredoxin